MSKARLIITAVVVEGRSQAEVARAYGVSKGWVSKLVARYRIEGSNAFEPRSRAPKTSPSATPPETAEMIVHLRKQLAESGLDAGADTIGWHLKHHHNLEASRATINRILVRADAITPEPRKRPRSSYIRFEADQPNECWQSDFTHYRLAEGTDTEVISWLDDHSRKALHISAHRRITAKIVVQTFTATGDLNGYPASTLTDNGMVYTVRFATGKGGRTQLENELRRRHIVQKNSRPNHPTTCGKVERFQQTMKKWLTAQPDQPSTIAELQTLLDSFADTYNHERPHRSLPGRATPASVYQARPKASPSTDPDTHTHSRVRTDKIDHNGTVTLRHNGKLHHIGIGRTHAGTHIVLLIEDLHIRVVDTITGELLRELILDPTRDYQPTGRPPGPTRKQ